MLVKWQFCVKIDFLWCCSSKTDKLLLCIQNTLIFLPWYFPSASYPSSVIDQLWNEEDAWYATQNTFGSATDFYMNLHCINVHLPVMANCLEEKKKSLCWELLSTWAEHFVGLLKQWALWMFSIWQTVRPMRCFPYCSIQKVKCYGKCSRTKEWINNNHISCVLSEWHEVVSYWLSWPALIARMGISVCLPHVHSFADWSPDTGRVLVNSTLIKCVSAR